MKIRLLLLALSVIFIASCKQDPIPDGNETLKYDAGPVTGPQLDAGYHELAVYFPSSTMSAYTNWKLSEVTWYMGGFPDSCVVKIYDTGSSDDPGALLYEVDYTGNVSINEWNVHLLQHL